MERVGRAIPFTHRLSGESESLRTCCRLLAELRNPVFFRAPALSGERMGRTMELFLVPVPCVGNAVVWQYFCSQHTQHRDVGVTNGLDSGQFVCILFAD